MAKQVIRTELNKCIVALCIKIAGGDAKYGTELLQTYLQQCGQPLEKDADGTYRYRLTTLPDEDAAKLYNDLKAAYSKVESQIEAANKGEDKPANSITQKQRANITAITKYKFQWSDAALFSFILGKIPALRGKLSEWEIKHSALNKLYTVMTFKHGDIIIKALTGIEKRNQSNNNSQIK